MSSTMGRYPFNPSPNALISEGFERENKRVGKKRHGRKEEEGVRAGLLSLMVSQNILEQRDNAPFGTRLVQGL